MVGAILGIRNMNQAKFMYDALGDGGALFDGLAIFLVVSGRKGGLRSPVW